MRASVLLTLLAVTIVAGCGGGGSDSGSSKPPPVQPSGIWTFTSGDTSTMSVWSKAVSGANGSGFSIVLQKDGKVRVTSYGSVMPGHATGTVDIYGNITTNAGSLRAAGTLTAESAQVSFSNPTLGTNTALMTASVLASGSYSPLKGTWTGTYQPVNALPSKSIAFTIDEAGLVRGALGNTTPEVVTGSMEICGYVNATTKAITIKTPFLQVGDAPLVFSGAINDGANPASVAGTVRHSTLNTNQGTWSAVKQ